MPTYIPSHDVEEIIHLSGEEIRHFLAYANVEEFSGEIKDAIINFRTNPGEYIDAQLVLKGNNIATAIHESVRIEVRNLTKQGDVAQVVARGIWGQERELAFDRIKLHFQKANKNIDLRLAGSSSFEFNVGGVNKSLAIRFLRSYFLKILDQIEYTSGLFIDSRKTLTLIAADGDSTLFEGPVVNQPLPGLASSVAREALIKFLEAGGVFILISGNDLSRSIQRLKDGLPSELYHRVLIAANGGADLAGIDAQGEAMVIDGYAQLTEPLPNPIHTLDIVYIGDDGSDKGNDVIAFKEVGYDRSVLVAREFRPDYDPELKNSHVGGLLSGTKSFIEKAVLNARQNPFMPIFNSELLAGGK